MYMKMKELESELEILQIQEDYLKDEQRHLKSEYVRSKEEVSPQHNLLTNYLLNFRSKEFSQSHSALVTSSR